MEKLEQPQPQMLGLLALELFGKKVQVMYLMTPYSVFDIKPYLCIDSRDSFTNTVRAEN